MLLFPGFNKPQLQKIQMRLFSSWRKYFGRWYVDNYSYRSIPNIDWQLSSEKCKKSKM